MATKAKSPKICKTVKIFGHFGSIHPQYLKKNNKIFLATLVIMRVRKGYRDPKNILQNSEPFLSCLLFFCFFFFLLPVSNFFLFEIRMSNFRIFEHSKVRMSRKYSKIPKHFLKKLQKSQTLAASQCFCLALRLVTLCCLELNLYSEFIRVDHDSTGYERQTDKLCYGSFKFFTTFTIRWSGFVWIMSIVRSSKKILDILDIRLAEGS